MATYSKLWIITYYCAVGLVAVCQPFFFFPDSCVGLLSHLALALPACYWLLEDARKRIHVPHIIQPMIVSSWTLAVPVYILWTRKWWGLLYVILHTACTYLVLVIGYEISLRFVWPVVFPNFGG